MCKVGADGGDVLFGRNYEHYVCATRAHVFAKKVGPQSTGAPFNAVGEACGTQRAQRMLELIPRMEYATHRLLGTSVHFLSAC
ncbi:hypothetical protein TPCCA_0344a [Treponema paraluiscuniculi Cuniculi A]|uniref:Uncharacterized protein n=2 Tax=Treponema paraluiscuniculi TaxID=53435 RepID=F7XSF6_TREPU|nr:hypothetical protein TPCCA_0344a [Treponema paraluiscuniculi Cuniculi A]WKC72214.1 hypothetical protein TPLL2_0344a [Treponema paraluiscuniculi]